jgi:hypothetical protein
MKTHKKPAALSLLLFGSFFYTPVASPQMPARPGKIDISSTTKGLRIFVNGNPRPEITPVTLVVSPGTYKLKIGDCDEQSVQVSSSETKQLNCPK